MKNNKYLEMWKIKRLIGWLDCLFDTCFLAFLWIMGWRWVFGVYSVMAILSVLGSASEILKLEKKI